MPSIDILYFAFTLFLEGIVLPPFTISGLMHNWYVPSIHKSSISYNQVNKG